MQGHIGSELWGQELDPGSLAPESSSQLPQDTASVWGEVEENQGEQECSHVAGTEFSTS